MKGKYKQPMVGTCILENVHAICCHSEEEKNKSEQTVAVSK